MSNVLKPLNVAVLGATGRVGQEIISVLEERNFPVENFTPIASARSAGKKVKFKGKDYEIVEASEEVFKSQDIVLASAGSDISKKWVDAIVDAGCVIIDNSSAFRMDEGTPLVVPEVNGEVLKEHRGVIANPNCSTSQLVVVLKLLDDMVPITRVVVSTYQSVSGAGKEGMDELEQQSRQLLDGKSVKPNVIPKQIAFNLVPHIDVFTEDGYTKEEVKVIQETRKILNKPDLKVTCTAVRVPVLVSHSESVLVEFEKNVSPSQVREALANSPGVEVWDEPENAHYPTPVDTAGLDPVYVGRIRRDTSSENGINMWVVADNLRIGAALNAVRIAEYLVEHNLLKKLVNTQ